MRVFARSRTTCLLALVAGLAIAGCGATQKQHDATVTSADGTSQVAVTLWDRTDLVVSIEPAPADPQAGMTATIARDPAIDDALIVSWLGGVCEVKTEFGFWKVGEGYRLSTVHETRSALDTGCSGPGVQRAIRVRLSSPVSPERILVEATVAPKATP